MSSDKEQILIAYCLKQGYLSMDQIKEFLALESKGKSMLSLIAKHLGWHKARIIEALNEAQKQTAHGESGPTETDDFQGQKFGKYVLVKTLGAGGMGAVYKAYNSELGAYFAIKTILPGHIGLDAIERFKREARISSQLRHPNIVQVYDVGLEGEQHYIVMEYIDGKDLSSLIQEGNLYPRGTFEIILKVAQALEYAHEKKVVHRDIKPGNILVTSENVPYLMDFGLASVIQSNTRITQSGQLLGTPLYMSPEQASGKTSRLDGRSDIYSLGAVLYEMLTGRPVVDTRNKASVLYKVVHEETVPLSRHDPNIPRDAEAICMKCLEKEPARRYQSAHELSEDIERYLKGYTIHARPVTALSRLAKWVQRNKAISIIVAGAVSAILISNFLYIWELRQERNRTGEALQKAEIEKGNAQHAREQAEDALKKYLEADKNRKEAEELKKQQGAAVQIIDEAVRWANEKRPLILVENKFEEAKKQSPSYSGLYRAWGKVYYEYAIREKVTEERGKLLYKGLSMLDKATGLSDDDYLAWFYKHLIFQTMEDKKNADKCIWKVAAINPDNEYGAFGEGARFQIESAKITAHEKKKELQEKAFEAYTKSTQYNKEFAWPYNNRGILYLGMNRYSEAMEDFNKAIALDPNYALAYNNRGNIYKDTNRYPEAMEDYSKAIALNPNSAQAYNNMGYLYSGMKRYKEAMEDYSKAIALNPNYALAYNNRGNIYYGMKRYPEAMEDFSKAIALDPNYALAYNNRGNIYYGMKRYPEAMKDYSKAIALNPNYALAYFNRGNIYDDMKRYPEAMEDYSKAIALDPNSALAYNNRGNIYDGMKRYPEAMEDFNKAIALDPNSAQAYFNRGYLYYDMKRYPEAIEDFSKSIALNPNSAQTYFNRGYIYKDTNRYPEAMEDFSKSIALNPNSAQAYLNRGVLYQNMKRYPEAMEDYNKAAKLDPNYCQAVYANRGILYYNLRQYSKALADLEHCKKLGIRDPEIEECLRLCKEAMGQK